MSAIRILHVDDEPDIREVVDISLGLNPDFEVHACSSGAEAIAAAEQWWPFLILLDVMMPGMDGPATLTLLHSNPQTADIPVLFMTARAQTREVEHLIGLGAQGVISKPFDPMTLAPMVQGHLQAVRRDTLRRIFMRRVKADTAQLKNCQAELVGDAGPAALGRVRNIVRGLAGAAASLSLDGISNAAVAVDKAVTARLDHTAMQTDVAHALDRLISRLENERQEPSAAVA